MNNPNLYIGLMSGTSIDAVDAVAVSFDHGNLKLAGHHSQPIKEDLRQAILQLCNPQTDSVQLLAETDYRLGKLYAKTSLALLNKLGLQSSAITAIGCHGQTIRHSAPLKGAIPYSLQIGDANIVAVETDIAVVADFRRKDMALGGQGAPLVPAFHRHVFASPNAHRVIVNIGGIANITSLPTDNSCIGFDTGPGNVLMDLWSQTHLGTAYDHNGDWAAYGSVNRELLQQLKGCDFFAQPAPKSTGRELFNHDWLNTQLKDFTHMTPQDIQATLLALSAETVSEAIQGLENPVQEVFICGGGAFNSTLMSTLKQIIPQATVATTAVLGLEPNWVEACAFAWLAKQRMEHKAGNVTEVTGASRETVLGAVYLP